MAKGNIVTVIYRTGSGTERQLIAADKAGRMLTCYVEKDSGISWLVVHLTTRGGTTLTTARYQLSEVVSYVESKALEE